MIKTLTLDIETDELPATRVWLIGGKSSLNGERIYQHPFSADKIKEIQEWINEHDQVCGHNIIDFDIPCMQKFLGLSFEQVNVVDTLLLSRLENPSRDGGHSLRSWGERLKFPKGDHNDWTKVTPEMITYCQQDVRVTEKLYEHLTNLLAAFPGESIDLEHQVQNIISKQISYGWLLDQEKCYGLLAKLKERRMDLEDEVQRKFHPLPKFVKRITPKKKADGTISIVNLKFLGGNWVNVGGEFSRVDFPEFNLGSRQQIGKYLQFFGWVPKDFTEKGQPIVNEDVLSRVKDIPEAQMIAEYLLVQKRTAQINSWLEAVNPEDGRVHGNVNSIGAVTGRMTHNNPNMAQVPASYSPYGKECRACWTVPKGYKLVGADASGLELRMLAHYMNDKEYTHEVINGDVHTANQKAAGLATRDAAKTFIYAFLYGAGDAKIGSIVGGTSKDGAKLKSLFLDNTPSLRNLRERVEAACARGHLRGLDGRKLIIRSSHAALNTLLQSAGAVVMKKALTLLDEYATIHNIEYQFVGNIHDEFQAEVKASQAEKFGWLAVECIKAAGERLELKCPLDGEYKVGDTWAETH